MRRNCRNDKCFNRLIDNLIYSYQEQEGKKRKNLENAIYMPMINSKDQVMGLIQIGNSDRQLNFSESDLDVVRLVAFKIANFISEAREQHSHKALF